MNNKQLLAHIKNLQKKEHQSLSKQEKILFWGNLEDKSYILKLKPCIPHHIKTYLRYETISTLAEVVMHAKKSGIDKIISTSIPLLKKLLKWEKRAAPSLANYAGSYFCIDGIEIVFIQPLKQLVTVSYGQFIAKRNIAKLTNPQDWYQPTEFKWEMFDSDIERLEYFFNTSDLIGIDIETIKDPLHITYISFTACWVGKESETVVIPIDSEFNVVAMRRLCDLAPPKVFQNGKYDLAYLTRYNCPVRNYLFDTAHFFHSWYSELPKDLGFLNAFFIRETHYWKDLAQTTDTYEYCKYNALDTWGTVNCFLAMIAEAPSWVYDNYLREFPLVFPCHLAEMTGIKRDTEKLIATKKDSKEQIKELETKLDTMLDVRGFNVNSSKQMKQLLVILGCADLKSADEKNLKKAMYRHPLNERILSSVIKIRKARKLLSTYFVESKDFNGRALYSLNPHGTDTSRLASREHHFWCGMNMQNVPRGPEVKQTLIADPDFMLYECDLEQAESRDTAYIAGEESLIDAVENSPDFHCHNASAFFGISFEELYDIREHKKLNIPIRNLAKNVNHGANYNMGPTVLIETMGLANIYRARSLLNLPRLWSTKKIAEHLLAQFHKTYPGIEDPYYTGVIKEVLETHMLQHHTIGEKGWVRYCFGDPSSNKRDLNRYVAHPPQALNAQTLNKAWLAVYQKLAFNPNFKLCLQVHDSILFQCRIGHEYLADFVKQEMEIPVKIRGYDEKVREFIVPAEMSKGALSWAECK